AAADLNGDGLVDLVAANISSNTVGVLLNTSPVAPTNHPPSLASIADQTVSPSQEVITLPLSATHPDGDLLTFSATGQGLAFILNQQAGRLTYHPEFDNLFGAGEKQHRAGYGAPCACCPS